jgi:hypothetical protein
MQRVIAREIEKVIDLTKLKHLVPPYCRVVKYDRIRGNTLKDVMGKYSVLIVLWNIHDKKKRVLNEPGHFFVISTRGPEKCVVFSSTGMSPSLSESCQRVLFTIQKNCNSIRAAIRVGGGVSRLHISRLWDLNHFKIFSLVRVFT